MDFRDIIERKKRGDALTAAEIVTLVEDFTAERLPDYQMAVFLMAVWFQGMTPDETLALTKSMLHSGSQMDLSDLPGPTADKHSTGGVGDKVSLLLAPLAAECGLYVPMLSGRGLGHTGGTLDKLESVPGYEVSPPNATFLDIVGEVGCAIVGQSEDIAPADGKIYALRDVTGTVDCVPLITASILSKKLAAGPETIVVDLKTGSGAFMSDRGQARDLAHSLIDIASHWERRLAVIFSDMSQPLGRAVGHANEVIEAFAALRADGRQQAPHDLVHLTEELVVKMVQVARLHTDRKTALASLREAWDSGRAFTRLQSWITAQGGRIDPGREDFGLTVAPVAAELLAPRDGHLSSVQCREVGYALADLGGTRLRIGESLDLSAGIQFLVVVGESITRGQPIATLHCRDSAKAAAAARRIEAAVTYSDEPVAAPPLILNRMGPGE